jgi:hypothetical protein
MDKYSGKFIHKIIRALTQASFSLMNFMLPACRPISAQVASTEGELDWSHIAQKLPSTAGY